jgi:hypothetical protein
MIIYLALIKINNKILNNKVKIMQKYKLTKFL